jgi:hypothetical protein
MGVFQSEQTFLPVVFSRWTVRIPTHGGFTSLPPSVRGSRPKKNDGALLIPAARPRRTDHVGRPRRPGRAGRPHHP